MYGNFKGVMPEDRVDNYGNQVLQTGSDPLGTKIGATQPTYEAAVAESNRIAELQNAYNNLLAMANRR